MGTAIKHSVPDWVKPAICHPGILTVSPERQSARMSKITNEYGRLNAFWHRVNGLGLYPMDIHSSVQSAPRCLCQVFCTDERTERKICLNVCSAEQVSRGEGSRESTANVTRPGRHGIGQHSIPGITPVQHLPRLSPLSAAGREVLRREREGAWPRQQVRVFCACATLDAVC